MLCTHVFNIRTGCEFRRSIMLRASYLSRLDLFDFLTHEELIIQLKYGYEGNRQFPLPRAQVYFQRRSRGK